MAQLRQACERAHVWISLELDGELAEVESGLLVRHLSSCRECAAFRERARGFTTELRSAASLPYRSATTPKRRRHHRVPVRKVVHLSAAAVAMLTLGGTLGHSLADRDPSVRPSPATTVISVRNDPLLGSRAPIAHPRPALPGQRNAADDF